MIGLDTNVLVRYLMWDDEPQSRQAKALIDSLSMPDQGFVSLAVISSTFDRKAAKVPGMRRISGI